MPYLPMAMGPGRAPPENSSLHNRTASTWSLGSEDHSLLPAHAHAQHPHPRAPESPLHHHPSPTGASLAVPHCNQSRCPTRTAAKYPGSDMLTLKGP